MSNLTASTYPQQLVLASTQNTNLCQASHKYENSRHHSEQFYLQVGAVSMSLSTIEFRAQ